jgi:hypothetical protein
MYPEFARFAKKAGHPEIASLFLKVAGEEKAHATWMRSIYSGMGTPEAGVDTVRAAVDYTLSANLENLVLTGSAAIAGTGNALDNVLIGNGDANRLTGLAGNDWLDGGLGRDALLGGTLAQHGVEQHFHRIVAGQDHVGVVAGRSSGRGPGQDRNALA